MRGRVGGRARARRLRAAGTPGSAAIGRPPTRVEARDRRSVSAASRHSGGAGGSVWSGPRRSSPFGDHRGGVLRPRTNHPHETHAFAAVGRAPTPRTVTRNGHRSPRSAGTAVAEGFTRSTEPAAVRVGGCPTFGFRGFRRPAERGLTKVLGHAGLPTIDSPLVETLSLQGVLITCSRFARVTEDTEGRRARRRRPASSAVGFDKLCSCGLETRTRRRRDTRRASETPTLLRDPRSSVSSVTKRSAARSALEQEMLPKQWPPSRTGSEASACGQARLRESVSPAERASRPPRPGSSLRRLVAEAVPPKRPPQRSMFASRLSSSRVLVTSRSCSPIASSELRTVSPLDFASSNWAEIASTPAGVMSFFR